MRPATVLPIALGFSAQVAAGCDAGDNCDGPGLRYIVHFETPDRSPPVDTGILYSNGKSDRFGSLVPPTPWPVPMVLCFRYGANAANGPATVWFDARPEGMYGSADVDVDLDKLVDVNLDVGYRTPADAEL